MYTVFWTNGTVSMGNDLTKIATQLGEFVQTFTYGGREVRQYVNADVHLTIDLPPRFKCIVGRF